MAQTFRQRIAQAEAMARADMLRFQPEVYFHLLDILDMEKRRRTCHVEANHSYFVVWKLQSGLTLSSDGILGPLTSDLPAEGLDLSDIPSAEQSD